MRRAAFADIPVNDWIALGFLIWMLTMVGWSVQLANWGDLPKHRSNCNHRRRQSPFSRREHVQPNRPRIPARSRDGHSSRNSPFSSSPALWSSFGKARSCRGRQPHRSVRRRLGSLRNMDRHRLQRRRQCRTRFPLRNAHDDLRMDPELRRHRPLYLPLSQPVDTRLSSDWPCSQT